MPERSFGRTIRYRRTKLGLSQAKLGELVGRSASTIRAWERDKTVPNDSNVVTALAAVLGIDEGIIFARVGMTLPEVETSPTVEEVLAELAPDPEEGEAEETEEASPAESASIPEPEPAPTPTPEPAASSEPPEAVEPAVAATPEPYLLTMSVASTVEPSYIEDPSQRQLSRVRYLATAVALVALVIALLWALDRGLEAFAGWWDAFFANLRF
jgi:transcriptional regulator with XRE-family HTH domain